MIIYVEDNINNQRLLQKMLSKYDLEVEVADNPYDGYDLIMEHQPEMIFVDVHLKTRDTGLDLVRWLREAGVSVPIVVVTCFNMLADRERALNAGCNDYVSKPYTQADMRRVLEKHIAAVNAA